MRPEPKPRVVAVIPARYGSTRLPGKSLIELCGKPLIVWVWERVRRAAGVDDVCVATDDDRIRRVIEARGGRVAMTRSDHPSGTDRVAEAVRTDPAEIVINVQGDEPLIDPGLIGRLAQRLAAEPEWEMGTAAAPIDAPADLANPAVVKVVCDRRGRALYFSRATIPHVRDAAPAGLRHFRHVGLYAYRRAFLERFVAEPPCLLECAEKLEQLRALDLGASILVIETTAAGVGVDTPEDVPRAEAALREFGRGGG